MKKYYVEVSNENVSKVLNIIRFWYIGKASILEPACSQHNTTTIEIEINEKYMKEVYSVMNELGIRNYKQDAA